MQLVTVTQKGQITLPKELRDKLGIKTYTKVRLQKAKDHIKVYRGYPDILDLAGKFKLPKGANVLDAREALEKNYKRF